MLCCVLLVVVLDKTPLQNANLKRSRHVPISTKRPRPPSRRGRQKLRRPIVIAARVLMRALGDVIAKVLPGTGARRRRRVRRTAETAAKMPSVFTERSR